jgi:hypothetical protein
MWLNVDEELELYVMYIHNHAPALQGINNFMYKELQVAQSV